MWIHWKIATKPDAIKFVWNGMKWNEKDDDGGGGGGGTFIALAEYEIVSFVYLFV